MGRNNGWAFLERGSAEGKPVVFLHGFMGSGEDWLPVVERLPKEFHCILPDLPGHGRTREAVLPHTPWTFPRVAEALISWLQQLQAPPYFLVGYSMGGRLALFLALHYPELFPRVVLESASPGLATEREREERRKRDEQRARELESLPFPQFLRDWYSQPLFASLQRHPRFPELIKRRQRNEPRLLIRALKEMGTGVQPSLWEKLPGNKISLLLLTGEWDVKFRRIAEKMVALTPQIQWRTISAAGHNIHLEQPEAFANAVADFFNS